MSDHKTRRSFIGDGFLRARNLIFHFLQEIAKALRPIKANLYGAIAGSLVALILLMTTWASPIGQSNSTTLKRTTTNPSVDPVTVDEAAQKTGGIIIEHQIMVAPMAPSRVSPSGDSTDEFPTPPGGERRNGSLTLSKILTFKLGRDDMEGIGKILDQVKPRSTADNLVCVLLFEIFNEYSDVIHHDEVPSEPAFKEYYPHVIADPGRQPYTPRRVAIGLPSAPVLQAPSAGIPAAPTGGIATIEAENKRKELIAKDIRHAFTLIERLQSHLLKADAYKTIAFIQARAGGSMTSAEQAIALATDEIKKAQTEVSHSDSSQEPLSWVSSLISSASLIAILGGVIGLIVVSIFKVAIETTCKAVLAEFGIDKKVADFLRKRRSDQAQGIVPEVEGEALQVTDGVTAGKMSATK